MLVQSSRRQMPRLKERRKIYQGNFLWRLDTVDRVSSEYEADLTNVHEGEEWRMSRQVLRLEHNSKKSSTRGITQPMLSLKDFHILLPQANFSAPILLKHWLGPVKKKYGLSVQIYGVMSNSMEAGAVICIYFSQQFFMKEIQKGIFPLMS